MEYIRKHLNIFLKYVINCINLLFVISKRVFLNICVHIAHIT